MKPSLVIDNYSRVWLYDQWSELYKCLSVPSLKDQSLEDLVDKCAPIHIVERGDAVKSPYKPVAEGQWVEVDFGPNPEPVLGRVKSYDSEKFFYEVVFMVPRGVVKEAP